MLEDVAEIVNGFAFKSEDYREGGILMVRSQNINNDGSIDKQNPIYLDPEKIEKHQQQFLQPYDYLMVMVGASLGKQGIVRRHNLPALLNQNMWNFRARNLTRQFFNYSLKNNLHKLLGFASGSAREFVRKSDYYKLELIVSEAALLNRFEELVLPIEEKISNNISEIEYLSRLRDGLLPKLMSGKIRVAE